METVLLIEDNKDIRENMFEILELASYKVLVASNGKEGASLAMQHRPDIIVCDIMMPELDGYGVIHLLQKNENTRNIPFIFLTAKAERSEIRKGMELGADDYITKPFEGAELLNAIAMRLKKTAALKGPNENQSENQSGRSIELAFKEDAQITTYRKKQIIYSERNHVYRLYKVVSGKVKTYKLNDEGKELITGIYNSGEYFGYVALLEGIDYREHAAAIEDAEIASIPKEIFEDITCSNPDEMRSFVRMLAGNVSEREDQLLMLAYSSLRKKVAGALLQLSQKYNTKGIQPGVMHISRENLAAMAGTAKESLIRTLSDFKDEGLIDISGGNITVLDEKRLSHLLN